MLYLTSIGFVYPYSSALTLVMSIFLSFSNVFKHLQTALCSKLLVTTWSVSYTHLISMERSNKYDLTCSHCGEFISINNIPTDENIINDSSVGEIKISNTYTCLLYTSWMILINLR